MDVRVGAQTVVLPVVRPARLSATERIDTLDGLARLRAWADAQEQHLLAAMAEPGDPPRSSRDQELVDKQYVREEIACVMRVAPVTVNARLHLAGELVRRLPDTLDALERGAISLPYARCLAEAANTLPDDAARLVEMRVLGRAGTQTLRGFRDSVTRAVLAVDPRSAEACHDDAAAQRRVWARPGEHGMGSLHAELTADAVEAIMTRVQAAADTLAAAEHGAGVVGHERRTADQLRADALFALVTGQALEPRASWQGRRPTVNVSVALSTLLDLDDEPGDLDGYGPIPAVLARRMAADPSGTWRRLVTDPLGGVIDVGRDACEPPRDLAEHGAHRRAHPHASLLVSRPCGDGDQIMLLGVVSGVPAVRIFACRSDAGYHPQHPALVRRSRRRTHLDHPHRARLPRPTGPAPDRPHTVNRRTRPLPLLTCESDGCRRLPSVETELVALGVEHGDEAGLHALVGLDAVGADRAERLQSRCFGLEGVHPRVAHETRRHPDVQMQPVLDRLALGNPLEEDPRMRSVGDDRRAGVPVLAGHAERLQGRVPRLVPLRRRLHLVAEHFGPERRKARRIGTVDSDLHVFGHACTLTAGADNAGESGWSLPGVRTLVDRVDMCARLVVVQVHELAGARVSGLHHREQRGERAADVHDGRARTEHTADQAGWAGEIDPRDDTGRDAHRDAGEGGRELQVQVPGQHRTDVRAPQHVRQVVDVLEHDAFHPGMPKMNRRMVQGDHRAVVRRGVEDIGEPVELPPAHDAMSLAGHQAVQGDHAKPADRTDRGTFLAVQHALGNVTTGSGEMPAAESGGEAGTTVVIAGGVDVRDASFTGEPPDCAANTRAALLGPVVGDVAGDENEVDVRYVHEVGEQAVQGIEGLDTVLVDPVLADVGVGKMEDPVPVAFPRRHAGAPRVIDLQS